jgi:two-component system sensor histidine kinase MtrB
VFRTFRARLIITVIALIGLTAGAVAVVSYVLVRNSLRNQLIEDAVARAEFNVTVLATTDQLAADAGKADFEASGLSDRFLLRGSGGVYVEFPADDPFASSLSLLSAGDLISAELREIIGNGSFGYEFVTVDQGPSLVVGGRRPPAGPDFYFFYPADEVDRTLDQLARVLIGAGIGIVLIGALGAGVISRRVLRPVAVAGDAAGAMADGDLSVRLPSETADELGRLAAAFNRMAASLEHQIDALVTAHDRERRFVADVSHELRTPLTALVNEAAMLEDHLDVLPSTERRVGEMLVADVARLRTLVEDLLEVSRLDSSTIDLSIGPIDVELFLAAVIADRLPDATLEVRGGIGSPTTDRRSLERIVGNLLDNARHHAPGSRVEVTATVEDGLLSIEVTDDGPGVPEQDLPLIFDRFYKLDSARRGGSGLGLAIARQHARRLGGDLHVRRVQPTGLAFKLQVPVTEPLHSGDLAETSPVHPDTETQRPPRSTS